MGFKFATSGKTLLGLPVQQNQRGHQECNYRNPDGQGSRFEVRDSGT